MQSTDECNDSLHFVSREKPNRTDKNGATNDGCDRVEKNRIKTCGNLVTKRAISKQKHKKTFTYDKIKLVKQEKWICSGCSRLVV